MTKNYQNVTTNSSAHVYTGLPISPVLKVVSLIVVIYIIISNGFVILFMFRLKYKKTRKRLSMILPLSFSDTITGISGLAIIIVRQFEESAPVSRYACAFVMGLLELGITLSLFHTFCICLERFLAVRSKTFFSKDVFGSKLRRYFFTISWIIYGLMIVCFRIVTPKARMCTLPNLYGDYYSLFVGIQAFGLWLPFLIGTVILYAITTLIIRSQMTKVNPTPFSANLSVINNSNITRYPGDNKQITVRTAFNDTNRNTKNMDQVSSRSSPTPIPVAGRSNNILHNGQQRQRDFKTKAIKIVGIIVLVFVLTTGVGVLVMVMDAACEWCVISVEVRHATVLLWIVNSAANPVIYACAINEFRQAVIRTFCGN